MTQTATETPVIVRDQTVIVDVPKDSRLEALLTIGKGLKEAEDAAVTAHEENKKAILAELVLLYPARNIKVYEITATRMYKAMSYGFQRSPYLPSGPIKEHLFPVYEAYKKFKESWVLREKKRS